MDQQGCCTLPVDDWGRVLDRLAGLEHVIPPDVIRQALEATDRVNQRRCQLTYEVMMGVMLNWGIQADLPIRQVFKHSRFYRAGERTPCRSALCQARQRLGIEPLQALHALVVRPLARSDMPGGFFHGLRRVGFDGTVFDVPDSEENRAAFDRASGGRGGGAFPQVRKTSLVELGTHVELAFACGGWQHDEKALARQLFAVIPPNSLLYEDRGFFNYKDWKALDCRGVKLLVRVKNQLILKPIQRLADGSYLAKIYPSSWYREHDLKGIVVRVLDYKLDDPQRVGHGERHRLITNLRNEKRFPAREMIGDYHERWEEELTFDEQKTHLDPRRPSKPAHLRSETPPGVVQELYALSLAHFTVRALMYEAACEEKLDVDRLSFTGSLHILKARLPECNPSTHRRMKEWYENVLEEIRGEIIEPRRNRINPRVIKRKMSKWPKKRPLHRGPPPLDKTFQQSVVMTM
jgi:Insertion element 4 transposase N-terminal/Transposase DDE domain